MSRFQNLIDRLNPGARFNCVLFCVVGIFLDVFFKWNPDLPWSHLFAGTGLYFEIVVLLAVLLKWHKLAYFVALVDVSIGLVCLLTLPVITTAENATGVFLELPFVSTYSPRLAFQVSSKHELLIVTVLLGFISTLLIMLFLFFDYVKLITVIHLMHDDDKSNEKKKKITKEKVAPMDAPIAAMKV